MTTIHRARRRSAVLAASLGTVGLLLAGCSAASSGSGGAAAADAPAPAVAEGGGYSDGGAPSDGGAKSGGVPQAVSLDRQVIVRADMTVRVDDLAKASDGVGIAAAKHGATIASQTTSSGDGGPVPMPEMTTADEKGALACPSTGCPTTYASSTTTLRVDNDEVDALIRDLSALGAVEASYRTTEDVSAQVADVDARLATAEASLSRVRALMTKAVTIGDVVTLEAELSRRQADLESLQAQQRVLADQTAQATVTVRLIDEQAPVVTEKATGFLAGLSAGWDAFTGAMVIALTVLGAFVPFLLVLVPLALLVWWLVRRNRRAVAVPPVETY
jgi:hypothetical protein